MSTDVGVGLQKLMVGAVALVGVSAGKDAIPARPCSDELGSAPWCDLTQSFSSRAASLVANLTANEKVAQLQNSASALPRLKIDKYQWWHEALHGVALIGDDVTELGVTTSWAEPIGVGASFNK
jgi:beta-glucosidase-like glycosyl hydrolase